jgi:hypothetical protein
VVGFCECGNETSGFIKDREFINQISDYQLLKNDFGLWSLLILHKVIVSYSLVLAT